MFRDVHRLVMLLRRLSCATLAAVALLACDITPANADAPISCTATSNELNFGTVNLLDTGRQGSTAQITLNCQSTPNTQILICVGLQGDPTTGQFGVRHLALAGGGGGSALTFNLYSDAAGLNVWGDVGRLSYPPVTATMTISPDQEHQNTVMLTIYGFLAANQGSLAPGTYDTSSIGGWRLTLAYIAYKGNAPACGSGGFTTTTSNFKISAVVQSDCVLNSASEMNFGTVPGILTQNVDTTAAISVTCNGTPYYVLLGDGQHATSAGGQRRMKGPNGGYVSYELYKDSQRSQRWGDTEALGETNTGNGQAQTLTVYGRVPPQPAAPRAGTYTDAVVVTVNY